MLSCFWANKIDFVNFLSQFSMIGYTAQFYNKTANIVIFLLFSWALSYIRTITRSHGIGVTSVVRETLKSMGEGKVTPLTTPTPQPTCHQILRTWLRQPSTHMPHLVKIAPEVTSHHIAKVATQFFLFISLYAKSFHKPWAQAVEPILTCDTPADAYSHRVVPFGG